MVNGNVRYLAVGRKDRIVIASHLAFQHDLKSMYENVIDKVLKSARLPERPRLTITNRDVGTIHYDSDDKCIYMIVTASDYPQRMAFKLLAELKEQFSVRYGSNVASASLNSLNSRAKPVFSQLASTYDVLENVDKISRLQHETNEIKDTMHDNIKSMLGRGKNISELDEKASGLAVDAHVFHHEARSIKRAMIIRNIKLGVIIGMVLTFIALWFIVAFGAPVMYALVRYAIIPFVQWAKEKYDEKSSGLEFLIGALAEAMLQ